MTGHRAFIDSEDDNAKYRLEYYNNPSRWDRCTIPLDDPIRNRENWTDEIKYLKANSTDVSDEIKQLPRDKGGIYIFYIKGGCLPFLENYILYVGRCKLTNHQNIRKRAKEYLRDYVKNTRPQISKMFRLWGNLLYYRCYLEIDNNKIDRHEAELIKAIVPPFNEDIPTKIEIQEQTTAF